jgi:hypothetical protein
VQFEEKLRLRTRRHAALASEASAQRGKILVRAPDTRPELGSSARGAQIAQTY